MLYDTETEKIVLGGMLVEKDAYVKSREILTDISDFGLVPHQLIYNAIIEVYQERQSTNIVLVIKQLEKDDGLKRVGGWKYVEELQSTIVETDSTHYYAQILKDYSIRRKFSIASTKFQKLVSDMSLNVSDILTKISEDVDLLTKSYKVENESLTAAELMQLNIPPVKWLVPDLLPHGLTILAGDAKVGKSFFGWNLAMAVALGGTALGNIDITEKRNVTYLALEDPISLLKERLEMIHPYEKMPENLHIMTKFAGKFNLIGLKTFEQHVDKTQSDLIIVDTWKHVCPNDSQQVGSAYDVDYMNLIPIQNFVHQKNISMILITHTRKSNDIDNVFNKIQGSMGMQAGCDTLLMLTKSPSGHVLNVKGRRILDEEYAMRLDNGTWVLEGLAADVHKSNARKEIIDLLKEAGTDGLSVQELVDLTEKKKGTVGKLLSDMKKDKEVFQQKERGNYYLTLS